MENFNDFKSNIEELLMANLFESAEILCSLFMSKEMEPNGLLLELYGDCAFAKKEFTRSLDIFRRAQSALSFERSNVNKTGEHVDDCRLKYKISQCLIHIGDSAQSLKILESIPSDARTILTNIALAKLYKESGLKRHAITSLKDVLRASPMAIECIHTLVDLSVSSEDIIATIESHGAGNRQQSLGAQQIVWLCSLVRSLCDTRDSKHQDAMESLNQLDATFPYNNYVAVLRATNVYQREQYSTATKLFGALQRSDPYNFHGMEIYCQVLYSRNDIAELSSLANNLLLADVRRAGGWLAAALYCELKGEREKGMQFVDKALSLEPRCVTAFNIKGIFLLNTDNPEKASISFGQANSLHKNMVSYRGLVDSALAMSKVPDAYSHSKELLRLQPHSSLSYLCLAKVIAMSSSADAVKERLKALKKAFKLNRDNETVLRELAELYVAQQQYEEAVKILSEYPDVSSYKTRRLYGKALSLAGNLPAALQQIHLAMACAPTSCQAEIAEELDNIEKLKRDSVGGGHVHGAGGGDTSLDGSLRSARNMSMSPVN